MSHPNLELQLDWDSSKLTDSLSTGPDTLYVMQRLAAVPADVTASGGPGLVLEVAAAEAAHSTRLNLRGMRNVVVEPSWLMLQRARARMTAHGAHLALIRGVAETLPFGDAAFDRVLLDAAIDHLSEPELSLREMTRVLKADGRLVLTVVNYGSLSVRLSRVLYRLARRAGMVDRETTLFWDTPVPSEHTFECTYPLLRRLCDPYLELDSSFGISMGWGLPGWSRALARLPQRASEALLAGLDRIARRAPRYADVLVTVWRPRAARVRPAVPASHGGERVIRPTDLLYPSRLQAEADFWARIDFGGGFFALARPSDRMTNAAYTGDPERSWLDDFIARGPFARAAALGCDEGGYEGEWLARGGSQQLDVYELSPTVIRTVRGGLRRQVRRRARFVPMDLSCARLPSAAYDAIWSSGCLHHVADLEHLFAEVERALKPGGLFAIRDYIGERRMRFAPERLARVNAVLRQIPARFRRVEAVEPPPIQGLSPFCGIRADDIVPLAEARFDVVHRASSGALFPLNFAVDLDTIAREAPEVLAQLQAAETAALQAPDARPCGVYLVLRKRT